MADLHSVVTGKRKRGLPVTSTRSSNPKIDNGVSLSSSPCGGDYENKYEVFLSFRGPDTRLTITDLLYHALIRAGICVFKDDEELRVGQEIGGELLRAITNSEIYIPIFSRNYASSKWCLQEITYMVECKKKSTSKVILPVFYDVDVSDVKLQTELYKKALQKHRSKSGGQDVNKQWEEALNVAGRIKGFHLKDYGLDKLTKLIVEEVCGKLWTSEGKVPNNLIGIHNPMENILKLLGQDTSNVQFLIIYGMGGIGKTTLARLIFNQISSQFQGRCIFLSNIRESTLAAHGIIKLQEKLLSEVLNLASLTISDPDIGVDMIKQRLKDKKVLIVLDDLNNSDQLERLAGAPSWFGMGSRIIITTRDVDYLVDSNERFNDVNSNERFNDVNIPVKCEYFKFYKVRAMQFHDAMKLFSRFAFRSDFPPHDYYHISKKAITITGGLPLAIKVIGPLFRGKGKEVCDAKLKKLENMVHRDVQGTLMTSYEDLDDDEKEIFLDIACFFIYKEKKHAIYYWEARGLFPKSGISVLINKSLIEIIDGDKLWMHELLRDLGRNIVHKENSNIPGKRSRLWSPKEAFDVLCEKKGTEAVVALKLSTFNVSCNFTHEQFATLTNMNFLELVGGNFHGDFNEDFSELRWFSWDNCPLEIKATNLSFKNLVVLKLSGYQINEEWSGWGSIMVAKQLKVLVLNDVQFKENMFKPQTSTLDDLKGYWDLEEINKPNTMLMDLDHLDILEECYFGGDLQVMHPLTQLLPASIGGLTSLMVLKVASETLTILPHSIGELKNLEHLCLRCPHLENLPSSIGNLTSLVELDTSKSGIKELLDFIGNLKRLNILRMNNSALLYLPDSIGRLESLNELHLSKTKITMLPESIENLKRLKVLDVSCTPLRKLPKTIGKVENLEELNASYCALTYGKLPEEIGELSCLRILNFHSSIVIKVPTTINQLSRLQKLVLGEFHEPQKLPELPTSLTSLQISSSSLELCRIPDLSNMTNLVTLMLCDKSIVEFPRTSQLCVQTPMWLARLVKVEELTLVLSNLILSLIDLSSLSRLCKLDITCFDPQSLIHLPSNLENLTLHDVKSPSEWKLFFGLNKLSRFELRRCCYREIQVDGLGQLKNLHLHTLKLWGCEFLKRLSNLSCLKELQQLVIGHCPSLVDIKDLGEVESLRSLIMDSCYSIQELPDLSRLKNLKDLVVRACPHILAQADYVTPKELETGEIHRTWDDAEEGGPLNLWGPSF